MKIVVNGSYEEISELLNIYEYLSSKGLNPDKVVVEHNHVVIPTKDFMKIKLEENDNLEVLNFVGGG